ncbi:MAG: hypothetical protein VKJ46_14515 [Leptolyngbyaceae bacterium]|nr:hypothetical protein [Leptolyngbyaceae bacterium]
MVFNFFGLGFGLVVLLLIAFSALQWLHVPTGSFVDWIIGAASFWWLLAITIVPWNIHFEAKEVLAEAAVSTEQGISVEPKQVNYAQTIAKRSFWIAIALHLLSAIGLYALSATGISSVGYISSAAALLLTALRPAVRTYQYLATRLAMIRQGFKYPREDVLELRERLSILESNLTQLSDRLNLEDPSSWASQQENQWHAVRQDLSRLSTNLEDLRAINQAEHQRLGREAQQAIAQLTTDGQFLDHVREIIRFFKTA